MNSSSASGKPLQIGGVRGWVLPLGSTRFLDQESLLVGNSQYGGVDDFDRGTGLKQGTPEAKRKAQRRENLCKLEELGCAPMVPFSTKGGNGIA